MDIDYIIEQDKIFFIEKENRKDKARKKRRALWQIEDNLWKVAKDKINNLLGDC